MGADCGVGEWAMGLAAVTGTKVGKLPSGAGPSDHSALAPAQTSFMLRGPTSTGLGAGGGVGGKIGVPRWYRIGREGGREGSPGAGK